MGGLAGLAGRFSPETWVPEGAAVEVRADYRVGDGDAVGPFTAIAVPGHTDAHHVLVDEAAGVAVIGDALFGADARGSRRHTTPWTSRPPTTPCRGCSSTTSRPVSFIRAPA
ncbi:hypothetical protein [Halobellus ruber]|uniref:Metallo-beta-lactamase domain-containing protein n=1 Tax=Halobellus ruber TaxID=2761102 RepID=A0A7J9SIN4_9EURY|nr:hypothetical protein [Halobellus ruber]